MTPGEFIVRAFAPRFIEGSVFNNSLVGTTGVIRGGSYSGKRLFRAFRRSGKPYLTQRWYEGLIDTTKAVEVDIMASFGVPRRMLSVKTPGMFREPFQEDRS